MSLPAAIGILILLLIGPIAVHRIERYVDLYILAVGIVATLLGGGFDLPLVKDALGEPVAITIAVIVAGILFSFMRGPIDRFFSAIREKTNRRVLAALSVFIVGLSSSVITAIIAALLLVEVSALLRLADQSRTKFIVAGCFAIGLGSALTPLGGPLSTLAASALDLPFHGLFTLLAPWVIPGMAASAIVAGFFARTANGDERARTHAEESPMAAIIQGARIYAFIAGLVLVSHAYAPLARRFVPMLTADALFWMNTVSAVLDNATLVAIEFRPMAVGRAREAILALLISGGMLIPGNIPNIVSAGVLRIRSLAWARVGVPMGLAMLGIYFALLKLTG
ncbi:MAG TPA: DUF1646 family protein [Candidatus Binataceae bacterium]|nr:DUF1646 family protein [Candidatus Binataceae bacterium]